MLEFLELIIILENYQKNVFRNKYLTIVCL